MKIIAVQKLNRILEIVRNQDIFLQSSNPSNLQIFKFVFLNYSPASTTLSDRVLRIHEKASTTLSQRYSAFLHSEKAFFNLQSR